MPIDDTFSRRRRRAEGLAPEVYRYDDAPEQLRTQVVLILRAALGSNKFLSPSGYGRNEHWTDIRETLRREWGVFYLSDRRTEPDEEVIGAVLQLTSIDRWLDLVELCFLSVYRMRGWRRVDRELRKIVQEPDDAIEELNFRFREAGVGYQFEAGQIVRVDSYLLHAQVVTPALILLGDPRFEGPQEEFLSAHDHYRAGEHEDAIVDANRAFESTMKAICDANSWNYDSGARASPDFSPMGAA